jgi:hypothetical protein
MAGDKTPESGRTGKRLLRWGLGLSQVALLVGAWFYFSDIIRVSPGPLVSVHAREASLHDSKGCQVCHGPRNGACTAQTCATCHADIRDQTVAKTGFHGTLAAGVVDDCGRCHAEHKGAEFAPVNIRSFILAGVEDPTHYAHAGLDFRLGGKHLSIGCEKCHLAAEVKVLEKGQKRFLGLSQDCTRCHKDVHEGTFGKNCQVCHGQEKGFATVAAFRHTDVFPLTGSHSGVACISCHASGSKNAVSELIAIAAKGSSAVPPRTCRDCHANPHSEVLIGSIAKVGRVAPWDTCTRCHTAEHKSFFAPSALMTKTQHAALGVSLDEPHNKVACSDCHAGFGTDFPKKDVDAYHARYPGRRAEDCRVCHNDPHKGEFEVGAFKGKDCLSCHTPKAFTPSLFDVSFHDQAAFKLEGRHRKLQCGQCHAKGAAGSPPVYHGTATDCRSCHKDPHGGQFNKPVYQGNDCRVCHTQDSFKPPTFTVAMHAQTSFALSGAHVAISCSRCHDDPKAKPGEVALHKFAGVPGKCSSCHADVHAGKFDGPSVPAVVAGRTDCARCHTTDSFRAFPAKSFDHTVWTGYTLLGVHAKLDCTTCHGRNAPDAGKGRTLGFAAGRVCQSCHSDPHAGQFGATLTVNCAKCHQEESTWKALTFNHQKDTRFPLDEVHVKVSCKECHRPMAVDKETKAIRYKPLGIKCGDCHDPGGPKSKP